MSVRENVAYPLRVRGVEPRERARRAGAMLELVGLAGSRRPAAGASSPAASSSASRSPGRSCSNPRALLLDEPLSALDAATRVAMRDEIRRIQTRAEHRDAAHHPRPGRGAVARRPHRRAARRPARAGRPRRRRSTTVRPTASSRASSVAPTCSTATSRGATASTRRSAASRRRRTAAPPGARVRLLHPSRARRALRAAPGGENVFAATVDARPVLRRHPRSSTFAVGGGRPRDRNRRRAAPSRTSASRAKRCSSCPTT